MKKFNLFALFMLLFCSTKINAQVLYEDFSAGTLPTGWTESSVSAGDSWEYGGSVDFGAASVIADATGNPGEYAHIDMSDDNDTTSLITPRVDISSLTVPRLVFFYNSQTTSTAFTPFNRLILDYWNGASWVNITVIDTLTPAGWTEYTFDISTFKFNLDSVQFRFSAQEGGAAIGGTGTNTFDQDLVLDEIRIEQTPTCIKPSNTLTYNITTTSADLTWTENLSATEWEVTWGVKGFTPGASTNSAIVTNDSTTITSLSPATTYDWYVRAICAPGDTSNWSTFNSFLTDCPASFTAPYFNGFETDSIDLAPNCWDAYVTISNGFVEVEDFTGTAAPFAGSQALYLYSGSGFTVGADTVLAVTPSFSDLTSGDKQIRFQGNSDGVSTRLIIGTVSSPVPSATFNAIDTIVFNTPDTYQEVIVLFNTTSGYNGTDEYIVFAHELNGGTFQYIRIDDFNYELAPTCPKPSNLAATISSATTTDVSWRENGAATLWEVSYDTTGFTAGNGMQDTTSSNPFTLTNLTPNSTYDFYVRSICSVGDTSAWSVVQSFTTPCVAFVAPYLENFDGLALVTPYTDLPNCWTPQVGPDFWDVTNDVTNTGHSYLPNIGDHTTGTGNYMWIDASSDITGNEMETPLIDMSGLNNPLVGFWFASNNVDNTVNHTINLDAWDGNAWVNVATERGNFPSWVEVSGTLPLGVPTTTRFRIQAVADTGTTSSTYFYNDLGIDDFFVTESPIPYYAVGDINKVDTNGVADSLNVTCFTSGTVAGVDLDGNNGISFTIIDQSSSTPEGISIFNFNDVSGYVVNEGDSIMVRGDVDQFNGLTQLFVDSIMVISTGSALPAHTLVTTLDETTESQLIRMENLTVTNVPSGSSKNIDLTDGTNNFTMRVDADTDVLDSLTFNVGDVICSVNGIGGQFDNSNPFTSGYQIFPMRYTDVVFAPTVDLGPDTIVCDTAGFMLNAGAFASYMWNTGDTTQMITPNDTVSQYIVTVMDANGCSATDTVDVTVTICVGINEVAKNNATISFFPNPNNGQFKLEIDNVKALNSTIEVVSINGQIVYTENLNINGSLSKDISLNVEKGLYFVRLINDNGVKVEKLIIK